MALTQTANTPAAAADFFSIDFFDIAQHNDDDGEQELVEDWLKGLGLSRYVASLQAEGLDHFTIIKDLDDDSIDHLIAICMMPRLHARQFRNGIEKLRVEGTNIQQEKLESGAMTNMSLPEAKACHAGEPLKGSDLLESIDAQVSISGCADEMNEHDSKDEGDDLPDEGQHKRKAGIVLNKTCSKSADKKRRRKVNKKVKAELETDAYVRELIEQLWKSSGSDLSEA